MVLVDGKHFIISSTLAYEIAFVVFDSFLTSLSVPCMVLLGCVVVFLAF
jgi:hypothetical protein